MKKKLRIISLLCFLALMFLTTVNIIKADMLEDFEDGDSDSVTWYSADFYQGPDYGTIEIDDSQGAEGTHRSLKITVTGGNGSEGQGGNICLWVNHARGVVMPEAAGCNRLSFMIKLPVGYPLPAGPKNFKVTTYSKNPEESGTTDQGAHMYHFLRIPATGNWTKVIINQHPQYWNGNGKVDPGNNPTAQNGWNYIEGFTGFFIDGDLMAPLSNPWTAWIDEIKFYNESEAENIQNINSIACAYYGNGHFRLCWAGENSFGPTHLTYEVRYSTQPITNENYDQAIPVTGNPFSKNWDNWYNQTEADFTIPVEENVRYYFAIKSIDPPYPNCTRIDYLIGGLEENQVPIANAGQDQTLTDSDGNGTESVTLDGSASSDPDGTMVSYVWTENGNEIAQGETADVELAVGIHDITLEVTDNDGATNTDIVRITVQSSNGNSLAISNVTTLCPSDQNVTIKWVTDQPANSKVEYGIDTNYGQESSTDSSLFINHCIILTGLSANTTYHFRVISQDGSGNTGTSDDYTFTTLPDHSNGYTCIWIEAENGVINSPMQIETDSLASNGKYITTPQGTGNTTNPSAEAIYNVDIRRAGIYYIWLRMNGPAGDNDALYIGANGSFDRVFPSQWNTYQWVRMETVQGSGNYACQLNNGINRIAIGHGEELARADKILITDSTSPPSSLGDTTPPGYITNFSAIPGDGQITLSWTNPSDSDFAGVMIRYRTDTWPADYNDGQLVGNKTGTPGSPDSFIHSGLQNETTYYYSAFTYDTSGNYSQAIYLNATPWSNGGANQAPTAYISASPTSGKSPLTVSFSGAGTDSDGTIHSYLWNFGDSATSTSQNPTHTYAHVLSQTHYTVSLTVTDDDGATSQATTTITVLPNSTSPTAPRNFRVE